MIVGFGGKAGAGKDTLSMFVAMHLYAERVTARRVALADSMKRIAKELGWNGQKDAVGRFALQRFGTELMRAKDPKFWINEWHSEKWKGWSGGQIHVWLVPDVRYINEAVWIRESDGILVRVTKLDAEPPSLQDLATSTTAGDIASISIPEHMMNLLPKPARETRKAIAEHKSETEMDKWTDWDFDVTAEAGDLLTLWEYAAKISKEIRRRGRL